MLTTANLHGKLAADQLTNALQQFHGAELRIEELDRYIKLTALSASDLNAKVVSSDALANEMQAEIARLQSELLKATDKLNRSQVNEIKSRLTADFEGRLQARIVEYEARTARGNAEMKVTEDENARLRQKVSEQAIGIAAKQTSLSHCEPTLKS